MQNIAAPIKASSLRDPLNLQPVLLLSLFTSFPSSYLSSSSSYRSLNRDRYFTIALFVDVSIGICSLPIAVALSHEWRRGSVEKNG